MFKTFTSGHTKSMPWAKLDIKEERVKLTAFFGWSFYGANWVSVAPKDVTNHKLLKPIRCVWSLDVSILPKYSKSVSEWERFCKLMEQNAALPSPLYHKNCHEIDSEQTKFKFICQWMKAVLQTHGKKRYTSFITPTTIWFATNTMSQRNKPN